MDIGKKVNIEFDYYEVESYRGTVEKHEKVEADSYGKAAALINKLCGSAWLGKLEEVKHENENGEVEVRYVSKEFLDKNVRNHSSVSMGTIHWDAISQMAEGAAGKVREAKASPGSVTALYSESGRQKATTFRSYGQVAKIVHELFGHKMSAVFVNSSSGPPELRYVHLKDLASLPTGISSLTWSKGVTEIAKTAMESVKEKKELDVVDNVLARIQTLFGTTEGVDADADTASVDAHMIELLSRALGKDAQLFTEKGDSLEFVPRSPGKSGDFVLHVGRNRRVKLEVDQEGKFTKVKWGNPTAPTESDRKAVADSLSNICKHEQSHFQVSHQEIVSLDDFREGNVADIHVYNSEVEEYPIHHFNQIAGAINDKGKNGITTIVKPYDIDQRIGADAGAFTVKYFDTILTGLTERRKDLFTEIPEGGKLPIATPDGKEIPSLAPEDAAMCKKLGLVIMNSHLMPKSKRMIGDHFDESLFNCINVFDANICQSNESFSTLTNEQKFAAYRNLVNARINANMPSSRALETAQECRILIEKCNTGEVTRDQLKNDPKFLKLIDNLRKEGVIASEFFSEYQRDSILESTEEFDRLLGKSGEYAEKITAQLEACKPNQEKFGRYLTFLDFVEKARSKKEFTAEDKEVLQEAMRYEMGYLMQFEDLNTDAFLNEDGEFDISKIFEDTTKLAAFTNELEKYLFAEDPHKFASQLAPMFSVAQGMYQRANPDQIEEMRRAIEYKGVTTVSKSMQGTRVTPKALVAAMTIEFTPPDEASKEVFEKKVEWLKKWILSKEGEEMVDDVTRAIIPPPKQNELQQLCKFWTNKDSVPDRIVVAPTSAPKPESVPKAHTCFDTLDFDTSFAQPKDDADKERAKTATFFISTIREYCLPAADMMGFG